MNDIQNLVEQQMKEFQDAVINLYEMDCDTWSEAIVDHCAKIGMDVDDCASMVSPFLVARLREEGIKAKTVKDDFKVALDTLE
jgi:saccharopine dehydrogenase-like NADP-dependent oxidoreductase